MRRKLDVVELRKRTRIKDLLLREQIIPYIAKQTGTTVSPCRVGRWIASGDLLMLKRSGRGAYYVTRKCLVDQLIAKYS
jgi:hypothetical protein